MAIKRTPRCVKFTNECFRQRQNLTLIKENINWPCVMRSRFDVDHCAATRNNYLQDRGFWSATGRKTPGFND